MLYTNIDNALNIKIYIERNIKMEFVMQGLIQIDKIIFIAKMSFTSFQDITYKTIYTLVANFEKKRDVVSP